jgi:hypothetical protein
MVHQICCFFHPRAVVKNDAVFLDACALVFVERNDCNVFGRDLEACRFQLLRGFLADPGFMK